MDSNSTQRGTTFFALAFLFLLLWSAYDYGGRYLHVQAFSQVLSGGLLFWCARKFDYPTTFHKIKTFPLLWPSLLWLLSLCLSWIFSVNQLASLEEIARMTMYFSVSLGAYLGISQFSKPEDRTQFLQKIITAIVSVGLTMALFGWLVKTRENSLAGTFYRTNDLAGYLLLIMPLSLGAFFESSKKLAQLFYGMSTLILLISIVVTNSRTSWLAAGLSLTLLLLYYRKRLFEKQMLPFSLGFVAFILVGLALNWGSVGPRLASLTQLSILKENATSWRIHLLQSALDMFKTRPLLGYGPGTYGIVLPRFMQAAGHYSIDPHNYYLKVLAELGAVGGLAFVGWLGTLFWNYRRRLNIYSPAVLCALIASLTHIAFDIDWSVSAIPLLFFTLSGIGLVNTLQPVKEQTTASVYVPVVQALMSFTAAALVLVPALNYFSARAYVDAMTAQSENKLELAQKRIQRAISLAPWPSGRHYHAQASFYVDQKAYPQALISGLKSIQIDPYNARYYTLISEMLLKKGETDQAVSLLEKRLELNPYRHPGLYTELAELYWRKLNNPQRALDIYNKGKIAFAPSELKRYEHYSPADRYELFTLIQGMKALQFNQNKPSEALALEKEAQKVLQNTPVDRFVESGFKSPTKAVENYWKSIAQADSTTRDKAVHPEAQIKHPPAGLFGTNVVYTRAERSISHAALQYTLPTTAQLRKQLTSASQQMIFETQLVADSNGWKIISHRPIKSSNAFLFNDDE